MIKILRKRWVENRGDILSLAIFKMDLIESFKYRIKQTLVSLFATLVLMAHITWLFCVDMSHRKEIADRTVLLFLFYLPSVIVLLSWFRACSICNLSIGWSITEREIFTKKQTRASLIFNISIVVFFVYMAYFSYRMFQITLA